MSKRARYDGPYEEIAVFDSEAGINSAPVAVVKRGHQLPADVRAGIRDELLAGPDWSEVHQATGSTTTSKKADD